ncbi:hypothetical protein LOC71_16600 [Rhodopirellula sp. JC740]|uniref:Protein BatD n=1 Tax=Rhodopirellula halodulae TaxID=2894198 RepID=A0ABS8NK40_9BACT|nr:hypothetical protein [Rhodopirellula sp. JC740]MCC9643907.1 hypothetical protein [Rhodopirellula sp. JC740]
MKERRGRRKWASGGVAQFVCVMTMLVVGTSPVDFVWASEVIQEQTEGPIQSRLLVSESEAFIAEPVHVELEVIAPRELQIVFPELGDRLGPWEILSRSTLMDLPHSQGRRWLLRLELETLEMGSIEVPTLEVQAFPRSLEPDEFDRDVDWDQARLLTTEPVQVDIQSLLSPDADPTKPEPIAGGMDIPAKTPAKQSHVFAMVALGGGMLFMAILAAFAIVKMKRRRENDWRRWAKRQVIDLKSDLEAGTISPSDALLSLSRMVRETIAWQMGTQAAVDSETAVSWLHECRDEQTKSWEHWFQRSDEVAFAGAEATGEEVDTWVSEVLQWLPMLSSPDDRSLVEASK